MGTVGLFGYGKTPSGTGLISKCTAVVMAHPVAIAAAAISFLFGMCVGGAYAPSSGPPREKDHIEQWTNELGDQVTDHYRPNEFKPYRQAVTRKDGTRASGECSVTTGARHGHWEFAPPLVDEIKGAKRSHAWYWYGDLITEGEWHLRNGKR